MHPNTSNPVKRRVNPVTAIIGFACQDGIIVASDSQLTQDNRKLFGKKVFQVRFSNGLPVIVATSGYISGASMFLEMFEEKAKGTDPKHWRSPADTAEFCMKSARAKIIEAYNIPEISKEQRIELLGTNSCSVLLAYAFEGKGHIFTLSLDSVWANKSQDGFEAMGTGGLLAEHTMKGQEWKDMPIKYAVGLAVYAIEASKRTDLNCSGPIQAGYIDISHRTADIFAADGLKKLQNAVSETYENANRALADQIAERFKIIPEVDEWTE